MVWVSAFGTAASRAAMLRAASSPAVGMRSNTDRTEWMAPEMTLTSLVTSAGVVHLQRQPEPLLHGLLGHPFPLVGRGDQVELGQRAAVEVGLGGVALRGEVGQAVVVAGDAGVGGADRVQRGPLVDIAVCDLVNLSHQPTLTDVRPPATPVSDHPISHNFGEVVAMGSGGSPGCR